MAGLGVVSRGVLSKLKYIKYADEAFDVVSNVIKKAGSSEHLENLAKNNQKLQEFLETKNPIKFTPANPELGS